jgi:hypothetical protein
MLPKGEEMSYRSGVPLGGIAIGVAYVIYGVYGFWWAVAYGLFWPTWVGYHLAKYLIGG